MMALKKERHDKHAQVERELRQLQKQTEEHDRRLRILEIEAGIYKLHREGDKP